MRFGDPTGMASFDWVQTANGQMLWDDRIKDDASAIKYYGDGAKHRATGYAYTSDKGGVVLGDNKRYTQNGQEKIAENATPILGDRIAFEVMHWFRTTDFVVEGKAKVSAGAQLGVNVTVGGIQGKVEAGADLTEQTAYAGPSEQRVHNFAAGEIKIFNDKARFGAKYDYTYQYYNSYHGPRMEDGTATHDWNIYAEKTYGPKAKPYGNLITVQQKATTTPMGQGQNGKTFYGLDMGASIRIILGVEAKVKLGFYR